MTSSRDVLIIGGGAAGYFAAIALAEQRSDLNITILEGSSKPLGKVRISGGGRCNVTHDCQEPDELIGYYPRGQRELLGPFYHFGTLDTLRWFESAGVALKTEADGRIFPVTDSSQTIIDALIDAADRLGITQLMNQRVGAFEQLESGRWKVTTAQKQVHEADIIVVCTGSSPHIWRALGGLGLKLQPAVPSLFAFDTKDRRLRELAGVSVTNAALSASVLSTNKRGRQTTVQLETNGPLLITHRGLSGPAILKMSAWGADALAACDYRFDLTVNWLGDADADETLALIQQTKIDMAKRKIIGAGPGLMPSRLFASLAASAGINADQRWADLNREATQALVTELTACTFGVNGKSTNKEEFVTAGGVSRSEVDFRTFAAKRFTGLYLAGEVIDVDALTGGFNFQAAWTGGRLAGLALAQLLAPEGLLDIL